MCIQSRSQSHLNISSSTFLHHFLPQVNIPRPKSHKYTRTYLRRYDFGSHDSRVDSPETLGQALLFEDRAASHGHRFQSPQLGTNAKSTPRQAPEGRILDANT